MGGNTELTGPDLASGITLDTLESGSKILGHAFGEAVLLARVGDEFFAIGASCSHYGGPLADGVITDGTVRCPWHHACFSLRTGEALRSPALSPVACYTVEQRDGHIVVKKKVERDSLSPSYPGGVISASAPKNVVIVGAGAAGSAAAEMLRRRGFDGSIAIVDEEPDSPYDRPNLSKDYLAGNAPEEWIPIRPSGFYEQHRITIVRKRATKIDVAAKRVEIEKGDSLPYDALLLATGSDPIHLPLTGADLPHVHYLRSLADSRSIIAASGTAKRAVVVGSSFIGLETAASLRKRNIAVDVVAPETLPLERILGPELGTFIKALHEEHGVVFHLGRKPDRVERDAVVLDDGTRLPADFVVFGVGVRPRLTLAESAGLTLDRGVSVNEYLETSVTNVYAAGDIARWPDVHSGETIRVEHWVVAQRMGQVAARNILGARERFDQVPFFWSAHYDISINYVGHAEKWDRIATDGDASKHDFAARYERDGKLLALATIFRDDESLKTEIEMERRVAR
jgi:apoptosis-inducing factor 3